MKSLLTILLSILIGFLCYLNYLGTLMGNNPFVMKLLSLLIVLLLILFSYSVYKEASLKRRLLQIGILILCLVVAVGFLYKTIYGRRSYYYFGDFPF